MNQRIKLFTHETIIHAQVMALEKTLNRFIYCEIALNPKGNRSTIQFEADDEEIGLIRGHLGYTVMILDGDRWLPFL